MSHLAKILSLSSTSAAATVTSALKTYFRSVRLIKNTSDLSPTTIPSYITNILLCGNCIDPENRNLYVFYIDTLLGSAWIIEINIDTREQVVVYYDKDNNIGFDKDHKIYNARVVHGRLVWTDNLNPIYQMDILRAKKSFYHKIGYGQYPVTVEWSPIVTYGIDQIVSNGNNFYKSVIHYNLGNEPRLEDVTKWTKLCLIEDAYYSMDVRNFYFEPVPPAHPPIVTYESDNTRKINNLRQTLFQIAYRYVYMDWRKSTFSPASIVPVPQAEEETATGLANEMISLNNKLNIRVNSGGEEVRAIDIIGRSSQDTSKWFLIETIDKFSEQERSGEISINSEPGYATLSMSVMPPTVTSTYGDWFLPAIEELNLIYINLHVPGYGNFYNNYYWSSTEEDASNAYGQHFLGGSQDIVDKSAGCRVRAVRTFTTTEIYALRDRGPAGGWIFYVVDNYNGTYTYYECPQSDQSTQSTWSNAGVLCNNLII
jgi:hypothetical protein